jgi:hypothetical protein
MGCWITILFGKAKVNDVDLEKSQFSAAMTSMVPEHLLAAQISYFNMNSTADLSRTMHYTFICYFS